MMIFSFWNFIKTLFIDFVVIIISVGRGFQLFYLRKLFVKLDITNK
jgi:hypothetical protein